MKELTLKQIDVFSTSPFCGNPALVATGAEGLSPEEMQRVAAEDPADALPSPSPRPVFADRLDEISATGRCKPTAAPQKRANIRLIASHP